MQEPSFNEFLSTTTSNISYTEFALNIFLSAILAISLSWIYSKYGNSLSNRKQFGKIFLLVSMTTMLMITIVKSSLALSLGLVGALSIIRFRAAIKEPEELVYLFLAIAIGLGFGAEQTGITILAFFVIVVIIVIFKKSTKKIDENKNLHLTIQSDSELKIKIEDVVKVLDENCDTVNLRRLDETKKNIEVSFFVEFQNFTQMNSAKLALQELDDNLKITFLDNKGIL